ncbi:MAG TPA: SCO family protein [Candidatus Omnitrophota bacterium]|nr:SCO family protein [Candidatus Omnitrophota bacterium]
MFRGKLFYLVIAGILGALIFSVVLFQGALKVETLPIYGKVNDFRLLDTEGREFTLKDLKGKVWLADFIFTTCGGICPVMTKNMAALYRSFLSIDSVKMVSISVNPEHDSVDVLSAFARKYHANSSKWHFLTGERDEIKRLAVESFQVGSVDEPIFHSDRFILVDGEGRIRGYYDGTQQKSINILFKDIAALIKERK